MRVCVTGGAGFIGANLVERLINDNHEVLVIDNFSTGDSRFLGPRIKEDISILKMDLSAPDQESLNAFLRETEVIFHLAANADVRGGWQAKYADIQHNVIATHNLALAAQYSGVREIIFSSTGCVYGDSTIIPTPETEPFPIQTSLYGASKVSAEGILSTFAMNGVFRVTVLRFVSVLGRYYHHGHVVDFMRQLLRDSSQLKILGNGRQKKSYISVEDCVEALVSLRGLTNFEVFNIGQDYFCEVSESAKLIAKTMNLNPEYVFGVEDRGWIGDNPFTFLDTSKAKQHGWSALSSIEESVSRTVKWILENQWVLDLDAKR